MTFRDVLAIALPLAITVFGFARWRDNGYWMPRYLHLIAVYAALIGFGLVWMSYSTDAPNKLKMWSIIVVLPALVYWAYIVYGGGLGVRKFNEYLSMHSSLDENEVLNLLRKYFASYRRLSYEELKRLIERPDTLAITSDSGKKYELRVVAETDRDDRLADVNVFAMLGELGRKRGIPVASTMFSKSENGVINNDGLNMPFRSAFRR